MKIRSHLLTLVVAFCAVIGLAATASSASADRADQPVDGNESSKMDSADGDASISALTIIRGWDNIGWSHVEIVNLVGDGCDNSSDVDYSMNTLGNNNNQLASIQLAAASNCVLILWDGPNFTGNSVAISAPGCTNLGSCNGANLWRRANSLQLI